MTTFNIGDRVRFIDETDPTHFATITKVQRTAAGPQFILDFGPDSYVIGAYAPVLTTDAVTEADVNLAYVDQRINRATFLARKREFHAEAAKRVGTVTCICALCMEVAR